MCDIVGVFSGCSGQQMNAVNPPVRACTSRTRSRCSIRSASVSPMPYIIVTDVFIPSPCAISMISSQRSAPAFFLATRSRTRCTRISPPPPGIESRPAARSSRITSTRLHAEHLREEIHFARAESVDVDRMMLLDVPHQLQVPLERDVRIVPALDQDLHAAECLGLVDLRADLLVRERVALVVLRPTVERAESAVGDAHVRVVDVAVHDIRHDAVRMPCEAHTVGLGAEINQRRVRVEVEEIARGHQAAGRKASEPSGTRPALASRRKKSVSPARCAYERR